MKIQVENEVEVEQPDLGRQESNISQNSVTDVFNALLGILLTKKLN